jgi:hypothetical protein
MEDAGARRRRGEGGLEGYLAKDTPPPAETIKVKNSDGKEEVPNPEF